MIANFNNEHLDSLEFVRQTLALHPEVAILAVTGDPFKYRPKGLLRAGVTDCLVTPFETDEVLCRLAVAERYLRNVALHTELRQTVQIAHEMIKGLKDELQAAKESDASYFASLLQRRPIEDEDESMEAIASLH